MLSRYLRTSGLALLGLLLTSLGPTKRPVSAQEIRACATVPELGSLVQEIGGDRVSISVFAKGTEDPHFLEAKPSFIKMLSECDVYVQMGLELESGWAPVLLQNARNGRVLPGTRGYLDAAVAINPVGIPTVPVDRSMGDVHPLGNPHYLTDPLNGLRVARLIQGKLGELQPSSGQYFADRYESFRQRLGTALVGEQLAKKYDPEKLAQLAEYGRLNAFLKSQGEESLLGGWLGLLRPHYGAKVVTDHNMWPYFARRFGVEVVGYLEPKPGIPPTTRHLNEVVQLMKANSVKAVLAAAYYDPRYAQFVSENTGATVALMANQVGARPGTDDYISMVDYNVRQLAVALGNGK
jgi:ABC-type Zn uptake system ZnuABC Zn-binding protein ZnuA